jgi:hypothetical protein
VTLAVEPVDGDDSKADAVERVLARVEQYPFEIERILMDRAAYVGELVGILRETAPPVFPVKTGKDSLREKLSATASHMTEETICEGTEHEQTYPLAVNVTYQDVIEGNQGSNRPDTRRTVWKTARRGKWRESTTIGHGSRRATRSSAKRVP